MSRRQAAPKPEELIKNLDDKVASIKAEIENIIEELKNDVTAKGSEIEENKKVHEESLIEHNQSLEQIKKEKCLITVSFVPYIHLLVFSILVTFDLSFASTKTK